MHNGENFVEDVANSEINNAGGDGTNGIMNNSQRTSGVEGSSKKSNSQKSVEPFCMDHHVLAPYLCNYCFDFVRGGVITVCGHLFCWTCLWPCLHDRALSRCPYCLTRLILHEDIIPFLGEGPHSEPDDGNVIAQPDNVPRPTGLHLDRHRLPSWFEVYTFDDVMVTVRPERYIVLVLAKMKKLCKKQLSALNYLQWFQGGCLILMLFLWMFKGSLE